MKIITAEQVHQTLSFETLVPELKQAFAQNFTMPQRKVFHLDEDEQGNHTSNDAFALLPSWNDQVIGTKAFTYFPQNDADQGLQSLYSKIMLFKRTTGEPLALVDGTSITYWRTAAVSALASQYLSNEHSKHLVLFGTGNLARYLIKAHLSVRSISKITLVARSADKAQAIIDELASSYPNIAFVIGESSEAVVASADIIICATGSSEPLFNGEWLSDGTHVDCLGNHMKNKRECDTQTVKRARVYVDSMANNLAEAGEILLPIAEGEFCQTQIVGELADICRGNCSLRESSEQITLFKSVGTAVSDLIAANYVYQQLLGA